MGWAKVLAVNAALTLVLFLAFDLVYTNFFAEYPDASIAEQKYRIKHHFYHHDLAANFAGNGIWGYLTHRICTNEHGFKDKCNGPSLKHYDFAFIGDSFTEAIGMNFEDSFVGRFAIDSEYTVANLAVSSYSPVIYVNKVKDVLARGIEFDHLVVFVDISDLQDDSAVYKRDRNGAVVDLVEADAAEGRGAFLEFAVENFQLSALVYRLVKHVQVTLKPRPKPINLDRSDWTFNANSAGYGSYGVDGAIALSVSYMNELYELLANRDIKLSVGVYPWPDQIFNDTLEKNKQTQIWRAFCENRCASFIDMFPVFNQLKVEIGEEALYESYFIEGDVHFNEAGNELIYRTLEREFQSGHFGRGRK